MNGYRNGFSHDVTPALRIAGHPKPYRGLTLGDGIATAGRYVGHGLAAIVVPFTRMDTAGTMFVVGALAGIGYGLVLGMIVSGR